MLVTLANIVLVTAVALIVGGAAGYFFFVMGVKGARMHAESTGNCMVCSGGPGREKTSRSALETRFDEFLMTLSGDELAELLLRLEPHQRERFVQVVNTVVSRDAAPNGGIR